MTPIKYKVVLVTTSKTTKSRSTATKMYNIRVDHLPDFARIEEHCLNVASRRYLMSKTGRIVRHMTCSYCDYDAFEHDGQFYKSVDIY